MYTDEELIQMAADSTLRYANMAVSLYNLQDFNITVDFKVKGATAGKAYYRSNRISYNLDIMRSNPDAFMDRTTAHEVAHLVVAKVWGFSGVRPHGREWKSVMIALGKNPSRCHDYDLSEVPVKRQERHDYVCSCSGKVHKVSTTRVNKMRRGVLYTCNKCRTPIAPLSQGESAIRSSKYSY